MAAELVIFKCLASVDIQDRHSPVVKEHGWILEMGSRGWSNDIISWDLGTGTGSYGRRRQMAVPGASPVVNGLIYVRGWVDCRSRGC